MNDKSIYYNYNTIRLSKDITTQCSYGQPDYKNVFLSKDRDNNFLKSTNSDFNKRHYIKLMRIILKDFLK